MKFDPTPEQAAIVAQSHKPEHLLVIARAGAAKTSTLILVAEAHPTKSILSLAFNAAIRDEMKERMPANVVAMTINGCGFRAWKNYIRKPCKVDVKKNFRLIKKFQENLDRADQDAFWENFAETLEAVGASKLAGCLPPGQPPAYRALQSLDSFFDSYPIVLDELQQTAVRYCIQESWKECLAGTLDFDDMLLCPAVAGVSFDPYDIVLVDEAQDLSPINHVLIKKIIRRGVKLIAVGDPCQAIYGFRGADTDSMRRLGSMFDAETLYLTTTFRCASSIVENVKWRAPDIQAAAWAKPGLVLRPLTFRLQDIPDGSAIICRNNAPLFSLAITLLRNRRYPELLGRDVVKGLVKVMKSLGKPTLARELARSAAKDWAEKRKQKEKTEGLVDDQLACIEIFLDETETLGEAMEYASALGDAGGRIKLMTGHRSKGLEFDKVFFLDSHHCRRDKGQDANIEYVIATRAKSELIYINSDTLVEDEEVQEEEVEE